MYRLQNISRVTVRLALASVLASALAIAQNHDPPIIEASLPPLESIPAPASSPPPSLPGGDAEEAEEGASHPKVSYDAMSGTLTLQSGWKRTEAFASYEFIAPASHPSSDAARYADTNVYGNSMAAGFDAYFASDKATAFHLTADLEMFSQTGAQSEPRQADANDFTVVWEVSRLLSSQKHPARALEIGVGGYQEWSISRPVSLGGSSTGRVPGYSLYSVGVETTFTLPEPNLMFSLRFGREHLSGAQSQSRIVAADISWSW